MMCYFRRFILLPIFAVLLSSCIFNDRLPKGFPDEEELAIILADIHLSESILNQIRVSDRKIDEKASGYYRDVLAKHNLTEEKFDTIVSWYVAHPNLYQSVYERVLSNLGHKEADWQRVVKEEKEVEERKRKEKELRNVWSLKRKYSIQNTDTIDRRIPFNFDVDTIDARAYRVSAFYQFLKGSMVKDSKFEVVAMYQDSSYDTVSYTIPSSYNNKKIELFVGKDKADTIINLSGFLLNHDTTEIIKARIKQIEFELIPRQDTIFTDEEDSFTLLSPIK